MCLPPFANIDHDSQMLQIQLPGAYGNKNLCRRVDLCSLRTALEYIDWITVFKDCRLVDDFVTTFDDFATTFTSPLSDMIAECNQHTPPSPAFTKAHCTITAKEEKSRVSCQMHRLQSNF